METESSDEDSAEDGKVYNIDFLSSIEIVLLYKADLFLMQNWRHVETVLGFLNLSPSKAEHTDFFRVKSF
ncbi:hypothetical protein MHBO_001857 [Bonamia ostreae]|uniref:UTP25 NTP hydrolase-like domain-containing protein n=1 Tax=Bonamia ostreae TaxID=126728 RepID=A0ABV2AKF3_9EUKA